MSTFTPAETLRQRRPLLLAMEAIGWFHMAGKAREEFLRYHGGDKIPYEYKQWHDLETPPFPWDDLLEWVKRLYGASIPSSAWPGSFGEFTEKHTKRDADLLGLLQAGHGMASGIEKQSYPERTVRYLGQLLPHMWLSSPFGHPKRNLLADPPEILSSQGWRQLVAEIRRVLEELRDLSARGEQDAAWWERWRRQAIGPESYIRRAFLSVLAETRLPNNDVTLWDQSYVAAALFKSAVAGALLDSNFPWGDGGIKGQVRWRLLTVAIGTEHYEERAVKIGDWTGVQGALADFFHRVSRLIEVDLAIGSLLYKDSSVMVFSFPGERFDEEERERQNRQDPNFRYHEWNFASWLTGWSEWFQGEVEAIARDLDLETPPHVRLSAPTRSLVPLVKERQEANKVTAVPVHRSWNVQWTIPSKSRGHVCPVCRVRLNGDPSNKGKPCKVCQDRRYHRRDAWLNGQLSYDTIWFEEVADGNGRLALLTFALDLEPWLNAERVDSLRAQAIPEWVKFNPVLSEFWQRDEARRTHMPNPVSPADFVDQLERQIRQRFRDTSGNWRFPETDLFLANLQEGFRHFRRANPQLRGESGTAWEERLWQNFYHQIVEDRADAPGWNSLSDTQRSTWLAHQLFRKLPSPGRVYRFWREAEDFFNDLLREFRQIAARSDNPWRVRRLVLIPDGSTAGGWKDRTLYDGRWRGVQCSLVYLKSLGGFITASNLSRLLQPEEQGTVLQGEQIDLDEEGTFRKRKSLVVDHVKEVKAPYSHLGVYHPLIPIECSPLRFRVVAPLEAASECVDLAISRWQEQSARVWDRLPLHVGVVAFTRTLPFQAVIEATRNLEERLTERGEEIWRVERHAERHGVVALQLHREDGRTTLRTIPVTMPDGRPDVFYPYAKVEDQDLRYPRDFRHPNGQIYRHVADLKVRDGIRVAPARITTLFMDSTAARFDVPDPRYVEDWEEMREVWKLLESVMPSQTALQRLRSELYRLQREWRSLPETTPQPVLWRDSLRALLATHLEVEGAVLETLTESAVNGLLAWAMEWHMTALKQSI